MRQAAFVVNSAGARHLAHLERLRRSCAEAAVRHGWEAMFIDLAPDGTLGGGGRAELARYLAASEERLVFAAGGDGMVRTCAQAIVTSRAAAPLAVLPWGTANLFAQAVGVPAHTGAALTAGFAGTERRIDLGTCDGQVFVAMAGIGLDAAVVGATQHLLKQHLGWLSYAIAGLSNLHLPPHDFTVRLDGAGAFRRSARTVVVGNTGSLPGGFPLLPRARLDDGRLDVGVLAPHGPLEWALLAEHIVTGKRHDEAYLERHQAEQVEVTAAAELPRQIDGETITSGCSLTIRALHRALAVRVP